MLGWLKKKSNTPLALSMLKVSLSFREFKADKVLYAEALELIERRAKRGHTQAVFELPHWSIKYRDGEVADNVSYLLRSSGFRVDESHVESKLRFYISWD